MAEKRRRSAASVARRRVRSAYKPAYNALEREKNNAQRDLAFEQSQVGNIYDDLSETLAPLYGNYEGAMADITDRYGKAVQQFTSTFSDSFAPAEAIGGEVGAAAAEAAKAAGNAYGTFTTGGFHQLASDQKGLLNYLTRMQTSAGLAEKDTRGNMLQDYKDFIDELRARKMDLREQGVSDRLSLIDQIIAQRKSDALKDRELDIAEDQFGKEFGLRKRAYRDEEKDERRGQRAVANHLRDERADKQARRVLRRTEPRVERLDDRAANIQAQLDAMGGFEGKALAPPLHQKLNRVEKKRAKVTKKRKRARRELRD